MPLSVKYNILQETKFQYPFRIFVSGSSQSGKTFLCEKILKSEIFEKNAEHIVYYHPDYLDECPVTWHSSLPTDVRYFFYSRTFYNMKFSSYQSGVPTLKNLCDLPPHTCIVLDDLYEECVSSKAIDYLFRFLSGKKQLSVIILSQRYFAQGKFAMNIRNNCNFTILLRNVDQKINVRIATLMSLQQPVKKAIIDSYDGNYWPYIFIDSSPKAQVTGYRVYTDIFGKYMVVYSDDGMKSYVVSEKDFLKFFIVKEKNLAQPRDVESISSKPEKFGSTQTGTAGTVGEPTCRDITSSEKCNTDESAEESSVKSVTTGQEKPNNEPNTFIESKDESQSSGEESPTPAKRTFDFAERAKRNRLRRKLANVISKR